MIYIAAHKKFNVPQLDNYAVLQKKEKRRDKCILECLMH